MTTQVFVKVPFAFSGGKLAIPEDVQPGGEVSFTEGYGTKYSEDPGATGLRLDREQSNELFYILSTNINQYQTESFPRFITTADNGGVAYSYGKFATVLYDAGSGLEVYQSLVAANTALPTVTANWRKLDPYNRLIENASPTFTGVPVVPTAAPGTNTTQIASTAFVDAAIAAASTAPKVLAMVAFDGDGGVSIIGTPFNVGSVTRNSAGLYTIDFASALPDADYLVSIAGTANLGGLNGFVRSPAANNAPSIKTTTQLQVGFGNGSSRSDVGLANIIIFG
jgi:hypothetical protein